MHSFGRYLFWLMNYVGFMHAVNSWSIPDWMRPLLSFGALVVYFIWDHGEDKEAKRTTNDS